MADPKWYGDHLKVVAYRRLTDGAEAVILRPDGSYFLRQRAGTKFDHPLTAREAKKFIKAWK